jgi:hypothetical protein
MILSFLQQKQKTSFYSDFYPSYNLGTLLLEFFHLYGVSFNYYHTGVSLTTDNGSYFPKYSFNNASKYTAAPEKKKKTKHNSKKRKLEEAAAAEEAKKKEEQSAFTSKER